MLATTASARGITYSNNSLATAAGGDPEPVSASNAEKQSWRCRSAVATVIREADTRNSMDHLYSLYDALVSINVPNDKARAVVDAMERDMTSTLATKPDLQLLRQDLVATLAGRDEVAAVKADVVSLRSDVALVRKDMEILSTTMTVRLGSMLIIGLGLLFAALELT